MTLSGAIPPVPAGRRVTFFTGLKKVTKESAFHYVGYGYCRFSLGVNADAGKNLCCALGTGGRGPMDSAPLGDAGGAGLIADGEIARLWAPNTSGPAFCADHHRRFQFN